MRWEHTGAARSSLTVRAGRRRPYLRTDRALAQVARSRVPAPPLCPVCNHPVPRHASEDGQPVCTRGQGLISCRDCAESWARMPAVAALSDFGRTLNWGSGPHRLVVDQPRRGGKAAVFRAILDQAVKVGDIVHVATSGGVRCAGGAGHVCALPALERNPRPVLARVIRTCIAVPSQWNAWITQGQYLYLRYRSGIGTVDAYDTHDSHRWTRVPDGAVARFDTGDRLDGEMTLTAFCEHTGLRLADDAEVIGE